MRAPRKEPKGRGLPHPRPIPKPKSKVIHRGKVIGPVPLGRTPPSREQVMDMPLPMMRKW